QGVGRARRLRVDGSQGDRCERAAHGHRIIALLHVRLILALQALDEDMAQPWVADPGGDDRQVVPQPTPVKVPRLLLPALFEVAIDEFHPACHSLPPPARTPPGRVGALPTRAL